MTTSLACFLGKLLKAKINCGAFSNAEILIVDDNAQLTQENRIRNTVSFASAISGEQSSSLSASCSHLNSRWSSQPSLARTSMKQSSNSTGSLRRNGCITGQCSNKKNTTTSRNRNAIWHVIKVLDDSRDCKLSANIDSAENFLSSNPLMSMNDQSDDSFSLKLMDAPQAPIRSPSPGSLLKPRLNAEKRKKLSANHSLRTALGDMAPKSPSVTERRRGVGWKEL